jgi:hypothetical protein
VSNGDRLATFVHISDLHFGVVDSSSGDSELEDAPPAWDVWRLYDGFLGHHRRALVEFVDAFDELRFKENARLIVTGDLSACAEYSRIPCDDQFGTANRYLADQWQAGKLLPVGLQLGAKEAVDLRIPGNHDHWGGKALSYSLPGTIFGGPSVGFFGSFKKTPFVCDPIAVGNLCSLVFAGIDSDADSSDWNRLLARGEFRRQLKCLEKRLRPPSANEIRVLLMHHSPMYRSPDFFQPLEITDESRAELCDFINKYDIAVVLTGHTHFPECTVNQASYAGANWDQLEARCGTTTVRDKVPPGWKSQWTYNYELPNNTFLVHRLFENADVQGNPQIEWQTEWYSRGDEGFQNAGPLDPTPVVVWPRP